MNITPKQAYSIANTVYRSVKEKQEIPVFSKVSRYQLPYLLAKAVLHPEKTIVVGDIKAYPNQKWDYISRNIDRNEYLKLAGLLVDYVNKHRQLPSYLAYNNIKISTAVYTYVFAAIRVFYEIKGRYPSYWNFNNKAFVKPTEHHNKVYEYFVKVFGNFGDTIDGALSKIAGKGYGYYYDDVYSNTTSIDRMKNELGVNCTDSCHVFYNIMLELIQKGKYKRVDCLHILCSGGDGHVRLRIQLNSGDYIYRDPAAVLSSGDVTYNWCSNGELLAVNPDWFMDNLQR